MSQLCGCLGSTKHEPRTQVPAHPEAGFMPRGGEMLMQPPQYDSVDSGYTPVVPLPRYTPRPVSLHEKTLGLTERLASDEKSRQGLELEEDALQSQSTGSSSATVTASNTVVDDASSAFSFPSSFGHTSTETRDTPPPPYSSCGSSFYARSRASSIRSYRRSESPSSYSMNERHTQTQRTEGIVSTPMVSGSDMVMPPPAAHVHMSHQHPHRIHGGHIGHHEAHPNDFRRPLNPEFSTHETLHRADHQHHHHDHHHHAHSQSTRRSFTHHRSYGQRRLSWESQ